MNHNWSATKQHLQVSSAVCNRDKPPVSFVRGQDSTMWDIVWVSPQGHRLVSVSLHFFCRHRSVRVPTENGSAETTLAEGGRNPVAGLWGRTLGENWPPESTASGRTSTTQARHFSPFGHVAKTNNISPRRFYLHPYWKTGRDQLVKWTSSDYPDEDSPRLPQFHKLTLAMTANRRNL